MRAIDEQFLALLRQEQGKLLRIARAITGQEADAWDMVQEATVAAYRGFPRFSGDPDSFGAWIRRILVNHCRNLLRARNRVLLLDQPGESTAADSATGPEERLTQSLLWDEVMAMEAHHRDVLALRFLVDMSVDDMAQLLAVPTGTIKSRLHRALRALRGRLRTDNESEVQISEH